VREQALCQPRVSPQAMFLLHGAPVDFRTSFLPSTLSSHAPPEQSFAIFLAQRGLDVWGLDMRSRRLLDNALRQPRRDYTPCDVIARAAARFRSLRSVLGGQRADCRLGADLPVGAESLNRKEEKGVCLTGDAQRAFVSLLYGDHSVGSRKQTVPSLSLPHSGDLSCFRQRAANDKVSEV
jgi:hypothetical protein